MREEKYNIYIDEIDTTFEMVDRYNGESIAETECIGFYTGDNEIGEFGLKVEFK